MKSSIQWLIAVFLIASGAGLTAGCDHFRSRPGQDKATVVDENGDGKDDGSGQGPVLNDDGTSSSGGGTGFDGKVFESYIVNPMLLPAYTKVLAPLFGNVKTGDPAISTGLLFFFLTKTWYIAPVELTKVSKESLGLTFVSTDTEQLARQKKTEIWIDKRKFDVMTVEAQADLILHEFVMTMYLAKYLGWGELCRASVLDCGPGAGTMDRILPPLPEKPLDDIDNENIRSATGWLKQRLTAEITEAEVKQMMLNKGFDRRFFDPNLLPRDDGKKEETKSLMVKSDEIIKAVQAAKLSGHELNWCRGTATGKSTACSLGMTKTDLLFSGFTTPGSLVKVTIDGRAIEIPALTGSETTLIQWNSTGGVSYYMWPFSDWKSTYEEGDKFHSGYLFFRYESQGTSTQLILDAVFIQPAVIVSKDVNRDPICLTQKIKATELFDDAIWITESGKFLDPMLSLFDEAPPFTMCSASNSSGPKESTKPAAPQVTEPSAP